MRFFSGIAFLGLLLALTMGNLSADAEPLWMVDPPEETFPNTSGSDIRNMTVVGNMLYYTANTPHNGREIWRSDGTAENTIPIGDLAPSEAYLDVQEMIGFQDNLYAVFASEEYGAELWRVGGTPPEATLVKDINPGNADANPVHLVVCGDWLFFTADDGVHGNELWKTDGTEAGTSMVLDLDGTELSSLRTDNIWNQVLVVAGGLVYVVYERGGSDSSWELWRSDGTPQGTTAVSSFDSSCPFYFAEINDALFFVTEKSGLCELWKSDGSAEGTANVATFSLGLLSSCSLDDYYYFAHTEQLFFFSAYSEEYGQELWRSDGTSAGTFMLKDIVPGKEDSWPQYMGVMDAQLFFLAYDERYGAELWVSDGTSEGTKLFGEVGCHWYTPYFKAVAPHFTQVGDTLFFCAYQEETGVELWKTDGTAAGTSLVKDIIPERDPFFPRDLTNVNGTLFFIARQDYLDKMLWVSDGSPEGTHMVEANCPHYSRPIHLNRNATTLNGAFYRGMDELYRLDPIENTFDLVKDLRPDSGSRPHCLATIGDKIFFRAYLPETGHEPFVSDGTAEGTKLLKDILPGSGDGINIKHDDTLYRFWPFGDRAVFTANDGTETGLWCSDGTEEGTVLVQQNVWRIVTAVEWNGKFLFISTQGGSESKLWAMDGTTYESEMLTTLPRGGGELFALNDFVLLSMYTGDREIAHELYKTDGTVEGTILFKDVAPGPAYSKPNSFVRVKDTIFFVANGGGDLEQRNPYGMELWRTDGTPEGTILVKDICPGRKMSEPELLTAVHDKLVFTADDGIHGRELWCSDGTEEGTVMVKDITGNALSSSPTGLTYATDGEKHCVVFAAWEAEHGRELWISDLTESGTHLLRDICPGILNSMPQEFQSSEDYIYFTADDGVYGFQIWALDVKQMMQEPEGEEEGEVVSEGEVEGAVEGEVVSEGEVEGAVEGEVVPEGEVEGAVEGEVISEGEEEGAVEGEVVSEGEVEGAVEGEVISEGEEEGAVEGEEDSEEQPYPMCGCLNTENTQKAMEYLFGDFLLLLVSGVLLQFFARYRKF